MRTKTACFPIAVLILMLHAVILYTQVPQKISFQGYLTDESSLQMLEDGEYSMRFSLYTDEDPSTPLWTEEQQVSVLNGVFNVHLGDVEPLMLPFEVPYYLGISIDGGEELSPHIALASSPYSLRAGNIDDGQVVRSLNDLRDDVVLEAGENISITSEENAIRISAILGNDVEEDVNWKADGDNVFNKNTGNVGIGTETPEAKLDVQGELRVSGGVRISGGSADDVDLSGTGTILSVTTTGASATAISGRAEGSLSPAGVYGVSNSSGGRGVFGEATHASGSTAGVRGVTASSNSNATGVFGLAISADAAGAGVKGQSNGMTGYGVWGQGGTGGTGVLGQTHSATSYGVWAYNSGTGVALRAEGSGTLIEAWDLSPVNVRFRVDNNGNVTADGTFTSPAADFAEMLPAASGLEPGDVLIIGREGLLEKSSKAFESTVVGVYSTKPAFLGGVEILEDQNDKIPLAVLGIVPVKASAGNGAIIPGDLLAASDIPGHAMRAGSDAPVGTIIGKSMTGLEGGTGVIRMLVTLQ